MFDPIFNVSAALFKTFGMQNYDRIFVSGCFRAQWYAKISANKKWFEYRLVSRTEFMRQNHQI